MSAPVSAQAPASWNPDADFWLGVMRRHGGLVRATARILLLKALSDALQGGSLSPPAPRHYPGPLGRYESAKAGLAEAGLTPERYAAACRRAATIARV